MLILAGVALALVGVLLPWREIASEQRLLNGIECVIYEAGRLYSPTGGGVPGLLIGGVCSLLAVDGALRAWRHRRGGMGMTGAMVGFVSMMAALTWQTAVRPRELMIGPQLFHLSFVVVLLGAIIVREAFASQPDRTRPQER